MTFDIFFLLLFLCSVLTGLTVEAIKALLEEQGRRYSSNLLAGGVSVVVSIAVSIFYSILMEVIWSRQLAVYLIALVFLSWLTSMVGYDKVIQAIKQIQMGKAGR